MVIWFLSCLHSLHADTMLFVKQGVLTVLFNCEDTEGLTYFIYTVRELDWRVCFFLIYQVLPDIHENKRHRYFTAFCCSTLAELSLHLLEYICIYMYILNICIMHMYLYVLLCTMHSIFYVHICKYMHISLYIFFVTIFNLIFSMFFSDYYQLSWPI